MLWSTNASQEILAFGIAEVLVSVLEAWFCGEGRQKELASSYLQCSSVHGRATNSWAGNFEPGFSERVVFFVLLRSLDLGEEDERMEGLSFVVCFSGSREVDANRAIQHGT